MMHMTQGILIALFKIDQVLMLLTSIFEIPRVFSTHAITAIHTVYIGRISLIIFQYNHND